MLINKLVLTLPQFHHELSVISLICRINDVKDSITKQILNGAFYLVELELPKKGQTADKEEYKTYLSALKCIIRVLSITGIFK